MENKEIFAREMSKLSFVYHRKDFREKEVISVWFDFLKEFDEDVLKHSFRKYVMENHNPPAMSDLINICKKSIHLKKQGITFKDV